MRAALDKQQPTLDRIISKNYDESENPHHWTLGVCRYTASDIDKWFERGVPSTITTYGVLSFDKDVDEEKLFSIVTAIHVRGKCYASESIKRHYGLT